MAKLIRFADDSRDALERGVHTLAEAVRVTIGPQNAVSPTAPVMTWATTRASNSAMPLGMTYSPR